MSIDFHNEIESLLYDQDRIVTYKLLNNQFSITPNEAKSKMSEFVKKFRGVKTFFVTYLILGENLTTKKKKVFLSNEEDFDEFKATYKILSKQIYSIHKNFIQDFELFYGADLESSQNNHRKSNIKIEHDGDFIRSGKSITIESIKPTISTSSKQQDMLKVDEPKKEVIRQQTCDKKSAGIATMFANQKPIVKKIEEPVELEKPTVLKKEAKEEKLDELDIKKNSKKNQKVEEKFQKDLIKKATKTAIKKKAVQGLDSDEDETVGVEKKDTQTKGGDLFDDESAAHMEIDEVAIVKKESTCDSDECEDEIKKSNKRKRKNKQASKALNSDDDDDEDDHDSKKSTKKPRSIKKPANTIEIDTVFNKENKLSSANTTSTDMSTSKKKQLVTKTYVDKDGYTVTEKVWEMIECSAEDAKEYVESSTSSKSVAPKLPVKKNELTKPKAANQSTLMSFFKKN